MSQVGELSIALVDLPSQIMPAQADVLPAGVQEIAVHEDLAVIESNRVFGNVDPRFGTPLDVVRKRTALARALGARRIVGMVPYASDNFRDLDHDGLVTVEENDYRIWPKDLWMRGDKYDPQAPPYMADLPFDGLITTEKAVGLALYPADCAPLALYDPVVEALALVHVGRGGAEKDIAPKVIEYMAGRHGADPDRMLAYFGPSIAPTSYILPERRGALLERDWQSFLGDVATGYEVDVVGYATQRMIDSGIAIDNISQSPVDVATHPDYFSFVDHKQSDVPDGRNGFMVMMKPTTTLS